MIGGWLWRGIFSSLRTFEKSLTRGGCLHGQLCDVWRREEPVLMEIHQTPEVPISQILRQSAPAERTLAVHLFQFSVRWSFLVSVPSTFDQRLHMQGGSVDFRWGGSTAVGSGTAVCCWRKAARLSLTCASVLVHLEKTLSINHCPRKAWQWLLRHCIGCVLTPVPCISCPSPSHSPRSPT